MYNVIYWKAFALFCLGHMFSWLQLNAGLVFDWWKGKEYIAIGFFGVPASILFLIGWTLSAKESGSLWLPRFLGFAASWIPFPIMTWYFTNESPFTFKTISCFFLACLIIVIQLHK